MVCTYHFIVCTWREVTLLTWLCVEYKDIIFSHPKPIKSIHLVLFFKHYEGEVAFRNILLKESIS